MMRHGARDHQPWGACWAVGGGPRGKRSLHAVVCHGASRKFGKLQHIQLLVGSTVITVWHVSQDDKFHHDNRKAKTYVCTFAVKPQHKGVWAVLHLRTV